MEYVIYLASNTSFVAPKSIGKKHISTNFKVLHFQPTRHNCFFLNPPFDENTLPEKVEPIRNKFTFTPGEVEDDYFFFGMF